MALDFGLLQPMNISGGIAAGRQEEQRNQLAQQQLATGNIQQQKAELELSDFKRRQTALDNFIKQANDNGKSGAPDALAESYFNYAITTGDPQHVMHAQAMLQAANERKAYMASKQQPAPQPIQATQLPPAPGAQTNFGVNEDSYKTWLADKTTNLDFKPWVEQQNAKQANALARAPAAAAPVNQLMAPPSAPAPAAAPASNQIDTIRAKINELNLLYPNVPAAKAEAALLADQLKKLETTHVVGNNLVNGAGQIIATVPKDVTPSEFERILASSGLTPQQQIQAKQEWVKKQSTHAPPVSVTVSTEKKYGEQFANKMADTDIGKMTTAEKAPQLAESANRIIDLVKQGNVFTGPAADIKLNIARALNVVGASNEEKIANTESLIAASGQSTLDAIKSAGLGTGQGFTDKDLKFLQGIAGGTIDLTAQTLTRLATLQHQAATRSAEAWNSRAKQLPKSVVEGTGLSMEPIKVPPLSPTAMFAVNPKTGERIQSLDGGNTWKPVGGK